MLRAIVFSLCVLLSLHGGALAEVLHRNGFEGTTVGPGWTLGRTKQGKPLVSKLFLPAGGIRQLLLQDSKQDAVASVAEATLSLDLANRRNVVLVFKAKSVGNQPNPPAAATLTRVQREFDGVSISVDGGLSWRVVTSLADVGTEWTTFSISLDAIAAQAGGYSKRTMIRFSEFGTAPAGADGLALDEVEVSGDWDQHVSLDLRSDAVEGDGPHRGRIAISLPSAKEVMTIQLVVDPPGTLLIPSVLNLPKRATSLEFIWSVPDNSRVDPVRTFSVRAICQGASSAPLPVRVVDNDSPDYEFVGLPGLIETGKPMSLVIAARDSEGAPFPQARGPAVLQLVDQEGMMLLPTSIPLSFSQGMANTTVTIPASARPPLRFRLVNPEGSQFDSAPFDLIRKLPIQTTDLVMDPARGLLYAGVPAETDSALNLLVALDPSSGSAVWSLDLGARPDRLAITDHQEYLYVGLRLAGQIAQIDLATRQIVRKFYAGFEIGPGSIGTRDLCTVAGQPNLVLASLTDRRLENFNCYGVAVFDQGVRRILAQKSFRCQEIAASPDPSVFYAKEADSVVTLKLTPQGIQAIGKRAGLLSTIDEEMEGSEALLWTSNGGIVDMSVPELVGSIEVRGTPCRDRVEGRLIYADATSDHTVSVGLSAFDSTSLYRIRSLAFPSGLHELGGLLRCAGSTLAFRSAEGVFLVDSPQLVPSAAQADLALSLVSETSTAPVGGRARFTAVVVNEGAAAAPAARLALRVSGGHSLEAVGGSSAVLDPSTGLGLVSFGDLAPGQRVEIAIETTVESAGGLRLAGEVNCGARDVDPSDNFRAVSIAAVFAAHEEGLKRLRVQARQLVTDPWTGLLWAIIPSEADYELAGSVVSIDPQTGLISSPIRLDGNPDKLVISRNGRFLYVTLQGRAEIQRIDLERQVADLKIPLGTLQGYSDLRAYDIEVLEGDGTGILVVLATESVSPGFLGVAAYDWTVRRPLITSRFDLLSQVEPSADPSVFFGYNALSTGFEFQRIKVTSEGVSIISNTMGMIPSYEGFGEEMRSQGDRVFMRSGKVIDGPGSNLLGSFETGMGLACPDLQAGRVFYLESVNRLDRASNFLAIYDPENYTVADFLALPEPQSNPGSFVRWGANGLAFRSDSGVQILESRRLVPSADAADVAVSISAPGGAVTASQPLTYRVDFSNDGAFQANEVLLEIQLDGDQTVGSFSHSPGLSLHQIDGFLYADAIDLPAGGSGWVEMTILPGQAGTISCTARISSLAVDPLLANNSATKVWSTGFATRPEIAIQMAVPTSALASDPGRGLLWAGIPAYAFPGLERAVVSINPLTGAISEPIRIKGNPSHLAISNNGRYLYVGFDDMPKVQRIDLDRGVADLVIPLDWGDSILGPNFAGEMLACGNDGHSILVSEQAKDVSPSFTRLSVYDESGRRPNVIEWPLPAANRLLPTADPDVFNTYDSDLSDGSFMRIQVDSNGVTALSTASIPAAAFKRDVVTDGRSLYTWYGDRIDALSLTRTGTFIGQGPLYADRASNRLIGLGKSRLAGPYDQLRLMELSSLATLELVPLPFELGGAGKMTGFGGAGIAFPSSQGLVFLRSSRILPTSPPVDLRVEITSSMNPVRAGGAFQYEVRITNDGPNTAPGTRLAGRFSEELTISHPNASVGQPTLAGKDFAWTVGSLAPRASATLGFTAVPDSAGPLVFQAGATSEAMDSDPEDNSFELKLEAGFEVGARGLNKLRVEATALAADPSRNLVWACLPSVSGNPVVPATLVSINPTTGLIERRVPLTANGTCLAISANSAYLYVGFKGKSVVQRVNLAEGSADLEIPLGTGLAGQEISANDINVLSGDGTGILVSWAQGYYRNSYAGAAIYDGAVRRPLVAGPSVSAGPFAPTSDPAVFLGYDSFSSAASVVRFQVSADGISAISGTVTNLDSYSPSLVVRDNRLLTSRGMLVDFNVLPPVKRELGSWNEACWLSDSGQYAYLLQTGTIRRYSAVDGTAMGSVVLNSQSPSSGPILLVGWGEGNLCSSTGSKELYFLSWPTAAPAFTRSASGASKPLEPSADTDGDGFQDGFEFLFGNSITTPDSSLPLMARFVAGGPPTMILRFPRRSGLASRPYRYAVSPDLVTWRESLDAIETITGQQGGFDNIEARIPLPAEGRGFVRLEWVEAP